MAVIQSYLLNLPVDEIDLSVEHVIREESKIILMTKQEEYPLTLPFDTRWLRRIVGASVDGLITGNQFALKRVLQDYEVFLNEFVTSEEMWLSRFEDMFASLQEIHGELTLHYKPTIAEILRRHPRTRYNFCRVSPRRQAVLLKLEH